MSIKKRIASVRYALHGAADLFSTQPNARIHATAALLVVAAGAYFHIAALEWVAVVVCIAMVTALEAVNTAIEQLTDLVSPGFNPQAGRVKDVAAAAVLLAAIGALVVGGIIFLPRFFAVWKG